MSHDHKEHMSEKEIAYYTAEAAALGMTLDQFLDAGMGPCVCCEPKDEPR
jgi:hypothetical protein